MTSTLEISVVHGGTEQEALAFIEEGFKEANRLIGIISAWQEGTELYTINSFAGKRPVKVCSELFDLIQRSIKISQLTNGLFDVTFASMDKVWFFDRPMIEKPSHESILNSIRNIDYRFIELNEKDVTVFIKNKGTKIELGAIGKGYIASKIKQRLVQLGIQSGLVNAGGDLVAWGLTEKNEPWKVGVSDPNKKEKFIAWLPVYNKAIATSGSYERFAMIDGIKYSHIIHPKTGYPVKGLQSVTVISPDAELCDAIATSVFLLGKEKGLEFVNQYNDIQCFIVDDNNEFSYSDNLVKKLYAEAV